jgi:Zn-dependent protease
MAGKEWKENFERQSIWDRLQLSSQEISELGVAWLISSFVLLYIFGVLPLVISEGTIPSYILLFLFTFGISFASHELMHKFAAQTFGAKAQFQLSRNGIMITFVSLLVGIPLISPGAVFWRGEASSSMGIRGRVSAAGPLTNLILIGIFSIFQAIAFTLPSDFSLLWGIITPVNIALTASMGIYLNIWLGVFNLIPVGPLDGSKVFYWNVKIWISLMGSFGLLWLFLSGNIFFLI